jgi:hypothetical protein
MGALPHRVCLAQPCGELVIELMGSDDPEAMHEQPLRVRTRPLDTRIDDTPLEVEIPGQGCLPKGDACKSAATALQCDRGLRDRVAERATSLGKSDELVVEGDDPLGLVAQMPLDGPHLGHQPRLARETRPQAPTATASTRAFAWRARAATCGRGELSPVLPPQSPTRAVLAGTWRIEDA